MPVMTPFPGMPGVGAEKLARHRVIAADGYLDMLPGGLVLDGAKTRDPDNPDYSADGATAQKRLRAGLLVGQVTASGKYANSILGVLQAAYTSGGTELTVTAAQAAEIVRRVGSSGSLKAIGPPTAAGTVATTSVTFSDVDTATGVITVTDLGVDKIAGTFIAATDGSQTPLTFLPDGWELIVPDQDGDLPFPQPPIAGNVNASNLLPWPSDSSLKAWVRSSLNSYGKFVFTEQY